MNTKLKGTVYSKDTVEFTTVAVQYCFLLESFEEASMNDLTDKLLKILPLLYLKASLVPAADMETDDEQEVTVTEENYDYILHRLYAVFGKDDTYLEVFMQDMKYSETPISASVSEDLTDIYQDLKNYITIYERGIEENMNDALVICTDNFKAYWGQKLVNVMRALHQLKYSFADEYGNYPGEEEDNEMEEIW